MMKAAISQLKEGVDDLTAFCTQVKEEETWTRESFAKMESTYSHLSSEHAKATKKPRLDEDSKVTGSHLLLENGDQEK